MFKAAPALVPTNVFCTLPNNCTELLNCFWSGPTSAKSLGTLFILSFIKTILAVEAGGSEGKGIIGVAVAFVWSG